MNKDIQHLKLLSLFHYIVGGFVILIGSIPIVHFVVGLMMIFSPPSLGRVRLRRRPWAGFLLFSAVSACCSAGHWASARCSPAASSVAQSLHLLHGDGRFRSRCSNLSAPFSACSRSSSSSDPSVKRLFETGETPYDPEEDEAERIPRRPHRVWFLQHPRWALNADKRLATLLSRSPRTRLCRTDGVACHRVVPCRVSVGEEGRHPLPHPVQPFSSLPAR